MNNIWHLFARESFQVVYIHPIQCELEHWEKLLDGRMFTQM
jgi:hypothetical protein